MKILLSFLLVVFTTNIYAQVVKTIEYNGLVHLSKPVALRMLGFGEGDDVDKEVVDKAIKKYFDQGYFNDIWTEFDGNGKLTFYFKEKAIISQVELKGWKESDEEVKDSVIQIKKGTLYDEKKLEAAKKRIIDAISQEGKIDSVVEVETTYLENGSVKVTFIVNEGEEIIIKKLKYSGVYGLDPDDFDDVLANKEQEFMGWFWGQNDGKMSLRDLEYDNLRIRDYYMQYGYLDAKVDEPLVRVDFDNYSADMSYLVSEGKPYIISKVSINQVKHVADDEKLQEVISLEPGEVFNIKTFRDDSKKIKTLVADLGYAFVQVVPDLKKDKEKHTVEVVFKVMPGDKVKIRNVLISGNNRTLDRIIRRELYLGPNDMYSLTDLTDSRTALGRLGFFDGNTIEEKRIDNKTMDLIVKVKEAPTGNIQLGGGYGSYGGLLVSIGVSDRNIWGSGINVGVKAEKSQTTQNYSFNISNPRLNDSDFSGNFSIYHSAYDYIDYSVLSNGLTMGLGHRFTRHISGYVGYGYSSNSYTFGNDFNASVYGGVNPFESYTKSGVTISAKWDNTDDYYLPRKGFELTQSLEKSGLGGTADFIKARTNFAKYYGLQDLLGVDAIFRYKARYYAVIDNGYIPLAEKFYMGGIGSVRGYQSYSLSPTVADSTATDGIRRVGGTQTFSNNVELSLPLIPKAKMRVVAFVDWGTISDNITNNLLTNNISRAGYGAGIEWFSPVGPIQLMFARPISPKEGDQTSSFEFTMGQRF
ncbi:outer membrane protein assembly factor BamA [Sulfurimonas autotrophica]|uniref:Outer membrane protein assembly factor BamA n=1 Tax=Sulfurimonas autotrophica (strain ATCC BAA-671 / DSM 16294 / JCM 11897 / OK10) TaxID=563040 RepID=E0UQD3_SULAO|nr:outer membrane protein assembly factor BamA [Sulfurimonas autotrophica]ADN08735.1 outer membrane protein assembly complex, YaeT protein [Sulfurimonas autotrophica DSM 16294]